MVTRPRLLGVEIDSVSTTAAIDQISNWLRQSQALPKLVFTPNPELLVYAQKHSDFKTLLNQGDLNLPDGIGVVWFSGGQIKQRVAGTDVVQQLVQLGGGTIGCVIKPDGLSSKAQLKTLLPQAEIITATEQFKTNPELILVALGSPAQEYWIDAHRQLPGSKVMLGIGASLDHLTGMQRRAPLLFQRLGLEWLWRLAVQPKRWKRIFTAVVIYPILLFTQSHHD